MCAAIEAPVNIVEGNSILSPKIISSDDFSCSYETWHTNKVLGLHKEIYEVLNSLLTNSETIVYRLYQSMRRLFNYLILSVYRIYQWPSPRVLNWNISTNIIIDYLAVTCSVDLTPAILDVYAQTITRRQRRAGIIIIKPFIAVYTIGWLTGYIVYSPFSQFA